jgi:RNA polymerase sigma-70 factor (ECF subfamily)
MEINTAEHDEDLDAVDRCRKGDEGAFEELVMRHQKRMLNISYRITGSYEDACEVVQDAFVSAYRNLGGFRRQSRFSTWLFAITVNLSRNRVQQIRTRTRREPYSMDDPVAGAEGEIKREPESPDPSPSEKLERKERDMKIQKCIAALDPEFRSVIVLRDVQGFSYGDISAMLRIAEGTVKSRLFRARESVRDCLKRILGGL